MKIFVITKQFEPQRRSCVYPGHVSAPISNCSFQNFRTVSSIIIEKGQERRKYLMNIEFTTSLMSQIVDLRCDHSLNEMYVTTIIINLHTRVNIDLLKTTSGIRVR